MVRTHRPPRGARSAVWLGTAVLCLATSSCAGDDASPVVPETEPEPIELNVTLSIPRFPGIIPATVRVRVRTGGGALAVDTVAPLSLPATYASTVGPVGASAEEVAFVVLIPGALSRETVTVSVDVMDVDGTRVYSSYDQALRDLGSRAAVTLLQVFYSGPGASARTLELLPAGAPVSPGNLMSVAAIVRDGSGVEIRDVPVSWTLEGNQLTLERVESADGRSVAYVRAGAEQGSGSLMALLPNDVQNSVALRVEVATADVSLSVRVPVLPGVQLSTARVLLRREDGVIAAEASVPVPVGGIAAIVSVSLEPSLERAGESFFAAAEVLDADGMAWLATDVPLQVVGGGTSTAVPVAYVGPGASASAFRIEVSSTDLEPGSLATAAAILQDAAGSEITGVPVTWSVEGMVALEGTGVVDGRATASIRAGDTGGTGRVTATLPSLMEASRQLVVRRPPRTLRLSVDVPAFPGIDLTRLSVTVRDEAGATVATRRVSLPRSGPVDLEIPGSVVGATVDVVAGARDAGGTLYYATRGPVAAEIGASTAVPLVYVGPGAAAGGLSVQVAGTPAPTGATVSATAIVRDGGGGEIANVPVSWSVTEGTMAVEGVTRADGRSVATVRVGSASGQVHATIPTGLEGEAGVEVEADDEPVETVWRIITKSFPSIPQVTLTQLDLEVWHEDGTTALKTKVPWESSSSAVPLVPAFGGEAFTIIGRVLDGDGTVWLAMDEPVAMAPDPEPTELLFEYVGPGADAASVVISPEIPATLQPGDEVVLEGRAYGALGVLIPGTPLRWTAEDGLVVDEVWMDAQGVSKARMIATGLGDIVVMARTIPGVSGTRVVSVEGPSTVGSSIDFETFPDGSRTCVQCGISSHFWSLGVTFRFTGAVASGGLGVPTTYRGFRETETKLVNDRQNQAYGGYLTGVIEMSFSQATSQVSFDVESFNTFPGLVVVYDEDGAVIQDANVTLAVDPDQQGSWPTMGRITITSVRGIARLDVKATVGMTFIDNLTF